MINEIKPILKWVGGKRELIPYIREFYVKLKPNNYIEPFYGGGAVYLDVINTFGIEFSKKSIIGDINSDLIELYKNIKSAPEKIELNCNKIELLYKQKGYYYIRDRFNGVDSAGNKLEKFENFERSAALILINRTCFNGLYRTNKKGLFNVPEGSYKNPKILDIQNLYKLANVLPEVKNIKNVEFNDIGQIQKGDLVYFDPPYHPLNPTSSFTSYSGTFGEDEQVKLRDYFKELDNKGAFVLLSNSASNFIKELYNEFQIHEVPCKRNINSKADKRGKILEYLIIGNTLKNA
jgi:DNA adenine methylase